MEYPLHQFICLGYLEIHIALSNPNIDVKILARGYCGAIVTIELNIDQDTIRKSLLIKQETERIE